MVSSDKIQFTSVQSLSRVWLFLTPWTAARQPALFFTVFWSLLKLTSIESVTPSNHLILYHPLLLLPSIFPSIKIFSSESALHIRWPSIGVSVSESIVSMNVQDLFPLRLTGLIPLQSKGLSRLFSSTTVQKHPFFSAQPSLWSNFHISAWLLEKNIVLPIKTFVNNVMSLLFNILSKFVIGFLPRSKRLLILWLQSPSAVWFWSPRK